MGFTESEDFFSMKTKRYWLYRCPACQGLTYSHRHWVDTSVCNTPVCIWFGRYIVNLCTGLSYVGLTFQEAQDFLRS